jgi:hypothetical protein
MRITAVLQLSNWLAPNLRCANVASIDPQGFHLTMSDGVQILDPAHPAAGNTVASLILVSTDAGGQIIAPWVVSTGELSPANAPVSFITTFSEGVPRCFIASVFPPQQDLALSAPNAASNTAAPGTWSYPAPSALTVMLQNQVLLNQIGPGGSLFDKLTQVASDIAANNGQACPDLTGFANEVRAQSGKKISTSQAQFLLQTIAILRSELNCGG